MQTPVTPLAGPCNRCISFPTPLCDDLVIWSPGGFPSVGYPRTPASCFFGGVLDPALGREEGGFRPILSPQRGGLFVCCFEGECVSTKRDLDPPPQGLKKVVGIKGGSRRWVCHRSNALPPANTSPLPPLGGRTGVWRPQMSLSVHRLVGPIETMRGGH